MTWQLRANEAMLKENIIQLEERIREYDMEYNVLKA